MFETRFQLTVASWVDDQLPLAYTYSVLASRGAIEEQEQQQNQVSGR
jgi:hypothetical protein